MITAMPRIAIAVHDFERCVETFAHVLGMPVVDISENSVASLGAKLAMCVPDGGSNIELMSPADPEAPLSQSLAKFLERRGEGLFALMLEAPDPNAEAEALLDRGLNVLPLMAGAGGRDVHPNSTHGVLIRVYPINSFQGQTQAAQTSAGLSGIERVLVAVHDIDDAVDVFGTRFALPIGKPEVDSRRGVRAALCNPPSGGAIELVSVLDRSQPFASAIGAFLDEGREGMFALVLRSQDLARTEQSLKDRGIDLGHLKDPDVLTIDVASTFGARIWIEAA